MKLGARSIGYFKDGIFVSSSQDHINTNIVDENGIANIATPYGERTTRTEVNEILDYTLKGYDKEIGAVRMGRRYYDSGAKRFLSADNYYLDHSKNIIDLPVESNLYSYAGNNPIQNKDSSGDCLEPVSAVMCATGAAMLGAWAVGTLAIQAKEFFTGKESNDQQKLNQGIGAGVLLSLIPATSLATVISIPIVAPIASQAVQTSIPLVANSMLKAGAAVELNSLKVNIGLEVGKFALTKFTGENDKSSPLPDNLPAALTNASLELGDQFHDTYEEKMQKVESMQPIKPF